MTAWRVLDPRRCPDLDAYAGSQYEAPQGEMERLLAGIWQDLLDLERLGRHDNFFELGGHSLSAMQAVARVASWLSIEVPIGLLFAYHTVQALGEQLDRLRRARLSAVVAEAGSELDDMLERVASLPDSEVDRLLQELTMEGRR